MQDNYDLKELSKEEGEALTKDMQEVLVKHGCEMSVVASIQLLKRVPKDIVSPIQPDDLNSPTDNSSSTPT